MALVIGWFIGALAATCFVTFILHSILKRSMNGVPRIVVVNLLSITVLGIIAGFGFADGQGFKANAWLNYLPAQILCFGLMLFGFYRSKRANQSA